MRTQPRILIIEDDVSIASGLQSVLREEGYEATVQNRGDAALPLALEQPFSLVITDLKLPGVDGLEILRQLRRAKPKLPVILITAHGTTETAIEATKWGVYEYLLKPFEVDELLDLVTKALEATRLMNEPIGVGQVESDRLSLVGQSRRMQEIYKEIGRVAATPLTVLIRGDTGTGKELVARAIYQHSNRAQQPFIALNCAAIPDNLLESELFGHERGAFTGANNRRIGRFEQADGGTLFLDEIGDMNWNMQAKLLRVLQERVFRRVGGLEDIKIDVRIIAATHCDLEAAMASQQFREDLYFRLSVITIRVPTLAQRLEDIPDLVRYFLQHFSAEMGVAAPPAILPEALAFLQQQPWPGNIRELENVVRQSLLLARGYPVTREHLHQVLTKERKPALAGDQTHATYISNLLAAAQRGEIEAAFPRMIQDLEPELYAQAIRLAEGNQAKAARWLGVTRLKMREKLTQFGLHPRQS